MTNLEKYNKAFMDSLEITEAQLPGLKYQGAESWDSVGHMKLLATLEETFDIMFDTNDIIEFNSYEKGMEILGRDGYGVQF